MTIMLVNAVPKRGLDGDVIPPILVSVPDLDQSLTFFIPPTGRQVGLDEGNNRA